MSSAAVILEQLAAVNRERGRRAGVPGLSAKVDILKDYQHRRFARTYVDLLRSPRYGPAARFFLDELYGPSDFTQRDAQFARVVPALVRLFPHDLVATVSSLAKLHALSERLDTRMGDHIAGGPVTGIDYLRAWQATEATDDRLLQISLTVDIAAKIDHYTANALLRNSLRLMRGPAHAAGLAQLQKFLEGGVDAFRKMRGSAEFMGIIETRELALVRALDAADLSEGADLAVTSALTFLP